MAKPRTPNQKKRYAALNKRLAKYVALVNSIYDSLALEAAGIVLNSTDYSSDTGKPFRFKDYPTTKSRVDSLMRYFSHDIQTVIYSGTTEEWRQSNLVQDLLANDVLKAYGIRRGREKYKRYYEPNNAALKAFQQRKDKGFTVSQKVWNQSYNFKRELEYAISSGIERGQSAITLSKRISKYLHDFPSLQKDYKERYGQAADCKDCEYRSIRLARSEINMAYRTAEQERWQQMDFIKGYEIKLSHSHPRYDVCDELAGIYPKWFKWTGWHPNDLCYLVPIVMTDEEWYGVKGKEIEELPDNFVQWARENRDRIDESIEKGTAPYWVQDNLKEFREAAKPYVMTEEDARELAERGFNVNVRQYNDSEMKGFDLLKFDKEIESILTSYGISIEDCSVERDMDDGSLTLTYFGTSEEGNPFNMKRKFFDKNGKIIVWHDDIDIPDELQDMGITKKLFQPMIKQYLAMGADEIDLVANKDIGGYAWGRYGFSTRNFSRAYDIFTFSEASPEVIKMGQEFLERYYSGIPKETPFPMRLLAAQPYGKELLLNTFWDGFLNLKDRKQVNYTKHYIGL